MKKTVIVVTVILCFVFCGNVMAEEVNINDIYKEQFKASGAEDLSNSLPDDVKNKLDEIDISSSDISWTEYFTPENIFQNMWSFLKSGGKRPFTALVSLLAVLLFSTAVEGFYSENKTVKYVTGLGITAAVVLPAAGTVKVCVSAVSSAGVFMLSFVPIFAAILVSRGKSVTAAGFSTVMLTVSQGVTSLCSFCLAPLTGMQLGLSVAGSTLPDINVASIGNAIKKASMWTLSLASTVLLGVLGIQTVVGGAADTLTSKTAKFVLGTAVPVVGATVGEALNTVRGCVKLLGTSVAVYGIAALVLIILPTVIELFLWRISLSLGSSAAEMLGQTKAVALIRSVDAAVSFILGVMILVGVLFIISLTVVAVV